MIVNTTYWYYDHLQKELRRRREEKIGVFEQKLVFSSFPEWISSSIGASHRGGQPTRPGRQTGRSAPDPPSEKLSLHCVKKSLPPTLWGSTDEPRAVLLPEEVDALIS